MEKRYSSADEVEQAFYRALQDKDIHVMSRLWLDADTIACIHPMGARLLGRREVISGWEQIFAGDNKLIFDLKGIQRQQSGDLAVHVLHELITVDHSKEKLTIVVTTNVYKQLDGHGWFMILHHASLSPKTVTEKKDDTRDRDPQAVLH